MYLPTYLIYIASGSGQYTTKLKTITKTIIIIIKNIKQIINLTMSMKKYQENQNLWRKYRKLFVCAAEYSTNHS